MTPAIDIIRALQATPEPIWHIMTPSGPVPRCALCREYDDEIHGEKCAWQMAQGWEPEPIMAHPSRNTDPSTAKRAGEPHEEPNICRFGIRSQKAKMLRWYETHTGTWQQAARAIVKDPALSPVEGARRRGTDLVSCGFLTVVGEEPNPGSRAPARVCAITDEGRRALESLRKTGWSVW
jgi:hypothetical protein